MTGWGIIAADVIVMANLAQIAGAYSFTFANDLGVHNTLDQSTLWSTVAGVIWIAVMTAICYRGIELSARIQVGLLSVEVLVLIVLAVVALVKVYSGHAESYSVHPSLSWFWPGGLSLGHVTAPALLTAVFIYWGWDSAVSINEETHDPAKTPGRAAIISTLLLLVTYAIVTVACVAFAGVGTKGIGLGNATNSANVFGAIGPALFGNNLLGKIGLLLLSATILTSASASTQTTILPTARTALSMGSYKAFPAAAAKIHPRYLTPTVATIGMGLVSTVFYLVFTLISVSLLSALIGSVGLLIAFYYGLTGFACAWVYRRNLTSSLRNLVMQGIIPILGGTILLVAFVYAVYNFAQPGYLQDANGKNITIFGVGAEAVVGVGALLIGAVLMFIWQARDSDFFTERTLPRKSADELLLVLAQHDPAPEVAIRLPDSGLPDILIAEDRFNLPPGARAERRHNLDNERRKKDQ